MIFKIIVQLFIFYLLYKLIFDFIVPLYSAGRQIKRKAAEMQGKPDAQSRQNSWNQSKTTFSSKGKKEDYIDFEEIK